MENIEGKESNTANGSATAFQDSAPKSSGDTDKIPNLAENAENGSTSTSTVPMSVQNQAGAKEKKDSQCEIEEMGSRESSSTVDVRKMEKDSLVEQKPIENTTNTVKDIPDKNVSEKKVDSSTNLPKAPLSGTGNSVDTHQKDESKSITMEQTKTASAATSEDVVNESIEEKIHSAAEMVEKPNSDKSGEVEIITASRSEAQGDKNIHTVPEESTLSEIDKSNDKNEKINNEKNQGTNDQTIAPNDKKVSDTTNCVSVEAITVEETNMDDDEEDVVVVAEVVTEECEATVPGKTNLDSSKVEKMTNEPMDVDTPTESGVPSKEKEVAASSDATTVKDTSPSKDTMLIDKVDKGLLTEPDTNLTKTATDKTESNLAPEAEEPGEKSAMDIPITEKTKPTQEKTLEAQPNKNGQDKPSSSSGGSSKPIEIQAEEKSNQAKTKTPKLSEDSEKSKASKKPMKLTIEQKKRLDDARERLINSKTYWRQIEVDDDRLVGWEAHECLREDKKHIDRYWLTPTGFRLRSRPEIERFLAYMAIMNDNEDESFALLKGRKVSGKKASPKKAPPKKTSPRKKIAASSKKTSFEEMKQSPKVPTKKTNNKRSDISVPVKSSTKRKKDETSKERNAKKAKTKKSKTTSNEVVEMTTAVNQTLMRRLARGTQKVEVAEPKSIPSFQMHREFSKKKAAKTSAPRVVQEKSHKSGLPNLADGKE